MAGTSFEAPIQEGYGTENSPLYDDILAKDFVAPPAILHERGNHLPKNRNIPFSVYLDPEYAKLELEHVWKKSWQFACREEELPEVGSCLPYDVGPLSFIIMRSGKDKFQAFYNSCMHKGTRLVDNRCKLKAIRCRFHGWKWNLDGSVKDILAPWDFPGMEPEEYKLQEIAIDRWGGCLFINPDPNCGPLKDALGIMPEHFKHFDMENRFTVLHTRIKIRCNWKVLFEGFVESYHVPATHHQIANFTGDINSRYDIFDDGKARIGRFMAPLCVSSPTEENGATPREAAVTLMKQFITTLGGGETEMPDFDALPDFGRKDVAAWRREMMKKTFGADESHLSDAEMLDGIQYHMCPNFAPWLGEGFSVMYQFAPYGTHPGESVFNIRMTMPLPPGVPRPPAAQIDELDFDQSYASLPAWGAMCAVYDQDIATLPMVQRGMQSAYAGHAFTTHARYQEMRCSALHEFVDEKIRAGLAKAAAE